MKCLLSAAVFLSLAFSLPVHAQGSELDDLEKKIQQAKKDQSREKARKAEALKEEEARKVAEAQRIEAQRQEQERLAEKEKAKEQCIVMCSRKFRRCQQDNDPSDCEEERCDPNYGGDPLVGMASLMQCKQDAKNEYRACQREARENLLECETDHQDCQQDCGFKY